MKRRITLILTMVLAAGFDAPLCAQENAPERQNAPQRALTIRPQHATILKDIEYARVGEISLTLDLYMPQEATGRPPLIVWIHGGGWRRGSKDNPRVGWLPDQGYAMASISYRLSHQAVFPAQIHDCKGAIRWLRAHADKYGYDATRIGIAGGSAGGHLCALLGATGDVPELEGDIAGHLDQSSRVQAVVDYFGPSDFTLFFEHIGEAEKPDSPLRLLLGGPLHQREDLARLASPALHITQDDPPLLILHGTADPLVPLVQSRHLHDRYREAGLESTLHVIEGGKHGGHDFYTPQRQEMVTAFFDRHIRHE